MKQTKKHPKKIHERPLNPSNPSDFFGRDAENSDEELPEVNLAEKIDEAEAFHLDH